MSKRLKLADTATADNTPDAEKSSLDKSTKKSSGEKLPETTDSKDTVITESAVIAETSETVVIEGHQEDEDEDEIDDVEEIEEIDDVEPEDEVKTYLFYLDSILAVRPFHQYSWIIPSNYLKISWSVPLQYIEPYLLVIKPGPLRPMFSKMLSRTESRIIPAPDPLLESNVISLMSTNLGWFVDVVFIELTNEPVANKYVEGTVYVDVSLTNLNTGPVQVNVLPLAVPVAA
jgi:hypothetical protein